MSQVELLVNGLHSPIGISPHELQFSWRYSFSTVDFHQRAYRILIATNIQKLSNEHADLWDSGWVDSTDNLWVNGNGAEFPTMHPLYWQVLLRTETGRTICSEPDVFVLHPKQWAAKWIWKDDTVKVNDYACFKKEFLLHAPVKQAYVCVSAHSQYKLLVNGSAVGGYISPAPSDPQKDKLFLGYDISSFLKTGKNKIEAVVLYQGGSGQNYVNASPGFFCECHVRTADGCLVLATDDTWRCTQDVPYKSGMPYQQNRRITAMEHYDATVEKQCATWHNAVCVPGCCSLAHMHRQYIPEGAVERVITPMRVLTQEDVAVYDAGCIVSGWVKLRLKEKPGTKICVRYSENLTADHRVGHNVANEASENYCDYFTMGDEETEWRACFSYKAFRYFEITGCAHPLRVQDVSVEVAHTAMKQDGDFLCDKSLLNRIFDACIQSQKNNALGQLVDCPHREQAQYLADADMQAESLLYFFDGYAMIEKVLADFSCAAFADGTFPFVYPSNYQHEDFQLRIPEWDLHFVTLLWKLYFSTGNKLYLQRYFETACRVVNHYLQTRQSENALIPKSRYWHISDWPYPDVDHNGECLTAQNIKIYQDLCLLAKMAEVLKMMEQKNYYTRQAEQLCSAIRNNLLDKEVGLFRDCLHATHYATGINALALCCGLFSQEEQAFAADYLAARPLESGTLLTLQVLRGLFEHGKADAAYRFLSATTEPSWGAMVEKGYGTVWEGFSDIESHSHAWNGYPARMFAEYLVGVRCKSAGFKHVEIKPYFPDDCKYLKATVHTPQGALSVCWNRTNQHISILLNIPYGVTVDVFVPNADGYQFVQTVGAGRYTICL